MSWLGGDPAANAKDPVKIAVAELEVMGDMFTKMSQTCWAKCVTKHREGDLTVGEMTCVDRCTSKYMSAHKVIGEVIEKTQKELEASQAAQRG